MPDEATNYPGEGRGGACGGEAYRIGSAARGGGGEAAAAAAGDGAHGPVPAFHEPQERPGCRGLGVPRHAPRALALLCPEALAQPPFGGGSKRGGAPG
uniref:Uncharacterized protein n=1 Tax=Oryza sativa subsp. japonica TaxID=39947 RepID=Q7XHP2_ORYSJ|nr:hypothetical protein [Oryza sativa Japonica Group]